MAVRKPPLDCGLDRSGARKASEIVMLIGRALRPSRSAMLAELAVGLVISLSQRRPWAIEETSRARFSERMGRVFWGRLVSGTRTSRRRADGIFLHGTAITL